MKSKRVKEFIDGHIKLRLLSFTAADIDYCATIAEDDMTEKAIKAYIQRCEWREGEDYCVAGYKCDKCPSLGNFKRKLMEE